MFEFSLNTSHKSFSAETFLDAGLSVLPDEEEGEAVFEAPEIPGVPEIPAKPDADADCAETVGSKNEGFEIVHF